jgi:hypothetical protein
MSRVNGSLRAKPVVREEQNEQGRRIACLPLTGLWSSVLWVRAIIRPK